MNKRSRSFQKRIGNGFFMNGPLTSGGLTYREQTADPDNNELKDAYNTNIDTNQVNTKDTLY